MNDNLTARTIEEAELYLNGYSLREIAAIMGVSHPVIHYDLTKRLFKISVILYLEVIDAMKDNAPKSIKNEEVQKRVLRSINDYLYSEATIEDIAKKYGVAFFTIYRDLHKRAEQLAELNPELVTPEMLEAIRCKLADNSFENLTPGNNEAYLTQPREKGRFTR